MRPPLLIRRPFKWALRELRGRRDPLTRLLYDSDLDEHAVPPSKTKAVRGPAHPDGPMVQFWVAQQGRGRATHLVAKETIQFTYLSTYCGNNVKAHRVVAARKPEAVASCKRCLLGYATHGEHPIANTGRSLA